jgi:hypothetical protein
VPFNALVVRVLIASPSDTANYRSVVKETLEEWNSLHGEDAGVMVLPVMWERDATPEMGDRPQGIINRQLVDAADVLIGVFWTRLGTPTSEAESGTAEEVKRFIKAGKRVLLYFSSEPIAPDIVDNEQLERLTSFREELSQQGLIDRFEAPDELRRKVTAAVTKTIREHFGESVNSDALNGGEAELSRRRANLLGRIEREREFGGMSSSGSPRYRTRERLIVENRGTGVAQDVTVSFEPVPGEDAERVPKLLAEEAPIQRFPPGATLEYPMASFMGMSPQWDVVFRWHESGAEYEERQTLR